MLTKKSLLKAVRKEQRKLPVNIELKNLLCCSNEEFIYHAFKFVLNREPDPIGKHFYLSKLRKGELTKEDIIILLRYSNEGKKAGVKIIGLKKSILLNKNLYKFKLKRFTEKLKSAMFSLTHFCHHKTTTKLTGLSPKEYAEFEEHFRGKEEEIKIKFKIYSPVVSDVLKKFEIELIKAVDLGCGRGEWLEILEEHGVSALGVEINDFFLNRIKDNNLNAVKADIFNFLKKTKNDTFHIITAFHVIEHIDINLRVKFLREVLRVLKKDGICILETPNPRNIFVGSGDFYRDPSHITPFFPDTLQFIGKTIGFSDSTSFFIEKDGLVEIDKYPFDSLENYISVSRDFAWIGKKNRIRV
ncbi:MAG: methyltransferase domain-containing protein [Desulfobacterales bacterium]|nr:methyltransferase domain-containing protein [Desulfobacterales bacterium]